MEPLRRIERNPRSGSPLPPPQTLCGLGQVRCLYSQIHVEGVFSLQPDSHYPSRTNLARLHQNLRLKVQNSRTTTLVPKIRRSLGLVLLSVSTSPFPGHRRLSPAIASFAWLPPPTCVLCSVAARGAEDNGGPSRGRIKVDRDVPSIRETDLADL